MYSEKKIIRNFPEAFLSSNLSIYSNYLPESVKDKTYYHVHLIIRPFVPWEKQGECMYMNYTNY